ncbi:hypothetical protein VSDG_07587 [Cytospora chrysosperma]|uniref:Uncharacterized protein n=1 Tax=Cytospora chrysosperma TaxID=252740 RepID=A0A423VM39_CYTCH|nr:hypothetical protein VSDG_07587 [Valsa sordida]
MGSSDVAPAHVPDWAVPLSTVALGVGVLCWDAAYVLMTLRSLKTKSYSMPLLGLALNVSWEIVYALYVCEAPLEKAGFTIWLLLDVGLIYTTVKFAPYEWDRTSPWVGRNVSAILGLMTLVGCMGHFAFVSWWLSRPGIGYGDKSGKWYFGEDGYDTTEMATWSAGVAQLVDSAGALAMLLVRGHSGGTSYGIWLCRTTGTISGLVLSNTILWHWWPEAHGYFVNPLGIFICGTALLCDVLYPFALWHVRRTEVILPDGRIVSAGKSGQMQAVEKKVI